MTTPSALNEYGQAEEPARVLLERLGWTYAPREALAAERSGEREVLLKGRLRAAPAASQRVADRKSRRSGPSSSWSTSTPSAWPATRRFTST